MFLSRVLVAVALAGSFVGVVPNPAQAASDCTGIQCRAVPKGCFLWSVHASPKLDLSDLQYESDAHQLARSPRTTKLPFAPRLATRLPMPGHYTYDNALMIDTQGNLWATVYDVRFEAKNPLTTQKLGAGWGDVTAMTLGHSVTEQGSAVLYAAHSGGWLTRHPLTATETLPWSLGKGTELGGRGWGSVTTLSRTRHVRFYTPRPVDDVVATTQRGELIRYGLSTTGNTVTKQVIAGSGWANTAAVVASSCTSNDTEDRNRVGLLRFTTEGTARFAQISDALGKNPRVQDFGALPGTFVGTHY